MLDPASGRPNRSSLRATERSNPSLSPPGANPMYRRADPAAPARRPTARLIAPHPARARAIDTSAPSQLLTWSATAFLSCLKYLCSMAAGAATAPLTSTLRASSRTTGAACGLPIAAANAGAPAKQAR